MKQWVRRRGPLQIERFDEPYTIVVIRWTTAHLRVIWRVW